MPWATWLLLVLIACNHSSRRKKPKPTSPCPTLSLGLYCWKKLPTPRATLYCSGRDDVLCLLVFNLKNILEVCNGIQANYWKLRQQSGHVRELLKYCLKRTKYWYVTSTWVWGKPFVTSLAEQGPGKMWLSLLLAQQLLVWMCKCVQKYIIKSKRAGQNSERVN